MSLIPPHKRSAHGSHNVGRDWPDDVVAASWVAYAQKRFEESVDRVATAKRQLQEAEAQVDEARQDLEQARSVLRRVAYAACFGQ